MKNNILDKLLSRRETRFMVLVGLTSVFLSSCCLAHCERTEQPIMDYSRFRLVFSYEYKPKGDKEDYKIIKYLSKQRKLSLKEPHYIYYYDGNYYIYHRYPITDIKRAKGPIIIPEAEAKQLMSK